MKKIAMFLSFFVSASAFAAGNVPVCSSGKYMIAVDKTVGHSGAELSVIYSQLKKVNGSFLQLDGRPSISKTMDVYAFAARPGVNPAQLHRVLQIIGSNRGVMIECNGSLNQID